MRLATLGLVLVLATAPVAAQDGRTFPERLPLDTPESTVRALVEAFEGKDFFAAYFMLSGEARKDFLNQYYLLDLRPYFELGGDIFIPGSILAQEADSPPDWVFDEIGQDGALIFDNLLWNADRNGQMPFSLAGATISDTTQDGPDRVVVTVALTGPPQTLEIELETSPGGDWKVDRIAWSGSRPELRPWGLPETKAKP